MRLKLITLIMVCILSIPSLPNVSAQEVRYDWLGLTMKEGTTIDLPGGYKLQAKIDFIGGVAAYAVKAQVYKGSMDNPCLTGGGAWAYMEGGGTLPTRTEIVVKENCPFDKGGNILYRIIIKGDESSRENKTIAFDIIDSIYSPDANLTLNIGFPKYKEYDAASSRVIIPVTLRNDGPASISWVKALVTWGRLEGEGSINLTQPFPPGLSYSPTSSSANYTFGGLDVNRSYNMSLMFVAGPGQYKYGNYSVNFLIYYGTKFRYEGFNATRNVKIFRYDPSAYKVVRDSVKLIFGLKYKGRVGNPSVSIIAERPTGDMEVDEGAPISFSFYLQNTGADSAYNVTIRVNVNPDLPTEITAPSSVAGRSFPIVVTGEMPPKARSEKVEFRIVVPKGSGGTIYRVNITAGYFDIRNKYYEATRFFTITVRQPGVSKLYVTKTISSSTVPVNGTIEVNVIVSNNGTAAASRVTIEDDFPRDLFKLISGDTRLTASSLSPGGVLALSYKLRAVREGVATFGSAKVTYVDPQEGQKTILSSMKSPVVVTVVKPELSVRVEDIPPNVTNVNSLIQFSIYMMNKGNGDAKKLSVEMEFSPGLYMVNPPNLEKGEGVVCDQPTWEPREASVKLVLSCDTVKPQGFVKMVLSLKAQTTGKQWIRVNSISYLTPDGSSKISVPTSYSYSTVVVTPFETRVFYLSIFTFSVLLVAMFVIGVTRGFGVSLGRRVRRRVGGFES
ncbi:MAG: DUF11 domain-containing protein [Candidatus Korarchaeum sp.]|nr:DUF11 domain-containing protein [Candidatus Korarchaeum sp.]